MSLTTGRFWAMLAAAPVLCAQPAPLTISQAVQDALRNYPSIQVSQEQITAAAAGIRLARTAYLPHVDTLAQVNRATRNNVFGIVLPQSTLPSLSGPVIGTNNFGTAWGSAVGVLVTWEPFDFGLRRASVDAASAIRAASEATLKRSQYDVAVATADAYLTLDAAQETVRAAQAAVDRAQTILRTTTALVDVQLRPGADASRAQAELAAAQTQLIQAQQAVEVARASVARFTGQDPAAIALAAPRLAQLPPEQTPAKLEPAANPVEAEQNAVVAAAQAQLKTLERSYFPRFAVQGAAYARGSGAEINGDRLGGVNGLAPNVQNYALGLTVTFPVMDRPAIQAKEAAQAANIRAQAARSRQIAADLQAQWNIAVATLNGARRVAANTPVQVTAARAAVDQATARYQSGLGAIDEVAESERLLTQAEIDDSLARLSVWRGLLEVATAAGDLQPFLAEASQ
jgi:outer membrane protein